ncbi:UNVERIFIED_CONTAM: hypothetical protein H355_007796 [Colinus virginianus]|nr:hypothetical protein H355_007796 [Colinus virginianus]
MSTLGIHIPDRRPAQEENDVDASHLLQRHHRCDAIKCFHPEGRDQAEEERRIITTALWGSTGDFSLSTGCGSKD